MSSLSDTSPDGVWVGKPQDEPTGPRVLIVDDDPAFAKFLQRAIIEMVRSLAVASDAKDALERLATQEYDVVISDINMPGMTGLDLVRAVRAKDLDLPIILVTGAPSVDGAASALELGAFRYLQKPVDIPRLRECVSRAFAMRELARTKGGSVTTAERSALELAFRRAMATLKVVYQPIVDVNTKEPAGYEALMRPSDPMLSNPPAMLDAAEKLGALRLLGRRVRNLVAGEIERSGTHRNVFVNLHSADLADDDLYDPAAPLTRQAPRVVLELTERASLEGISDLESRLERLRALGYRLAVDDLGAGYAGLSYFASIRPELVKIDMSLVRSVDTDPVRQRVVSSLVNLAVGLGMEVVGEGVETVAERDMMVRLGCHYLQGYALARPGPPFPTPQWT